jgi:hypothetical protein
MANVNEQSTLVSSPSYSWIFSTVFGMGHVLSDYRDLLFYPVQTPETVLIIDKHFLSNLDQGEELKQAYEGSEPIASFESEVNSIDSTKYPYTNLRWNFEGSVVEVRASRTINSE